MRTDRRSKNLSNIRRGIRKTMESLARTHRGCDTARGCGCAIDKALLLLEETESKLFYIELALLSTPASDSEPETSKVERVGRSVKVK